MRQATRASAVVGLLAVIAAYACAHAGLAAANDCGPRAVSQLLAAFGREIAYADVLEACHYTGTHTSMADLRMGAQRFGLRLRGSRFAVSRLPGAPSIVHMSGGHFRVFEGVVAGFALVRREDGQVESLSLEHFHQQWSGVGLVCRDPAPVRPVAVADALEKDLGAVPPLSSLSLEFAIANAGTAPLTVKQVQAGCDCTEARVSSRVIPPGASVRLDVRYRGDRLVPRFEHEIRLSTSDPVQPQLRLICRGRFVPDDPAAYLTRVRGAFGKQHGPVLFPDALERDFGTVACGQVLSSQFTMWNLGDEPLSVSRVQGDCGCLGIAIDPEVIPPGESASLIARMATRGMGGGVEVSIDVWTNDVVSEQTTVMLKAVIAQQLQLIPPVLDFGEIPLGVQERRLVTLISYEDPTLVVKGVSMRSEAVTMSEWREVPSTANWPDPAKRRLQAEVTLDSQNLADALETEIVVNTSSEVTPRISVPVRARVVCPFEVDPPVLVWSGERDAGVSKRATIQSKAGPVPLILVSCPGDLMAQLGKNQLGLHCLSVTLKAKVTERRIGDIVLHAAHERCPEIRVRVMALP